MCRRSGSRRRTRRCPRGTRTAGARSVSNRRFIAGSSTLSTGLPSINQFASASRKAGTPWRPRRVCRLIARSQRDRRRQAAGDDVADGVDDGGRIDRPEVAQEAQHVGGRDVRAQHGLQVASIPGAVDDHALELRTAGAVADDELDRIVVGAGDSPQPRGRPVRGQGSGHGEDGGGDRLQPGRWRAGEAGDPRVDELEGSAVDRSIPRRVGGTEPQGGSG